MFINDSIMLHYDFYGFNKSHSLRKLSNNVFLGFSSMEFATAGIDSPTDIFTVVQNAMHSTLK